MDFGHKKTKRLMHAWFSKVQIIETGMHIDISRYSYVVGEASVPYL